MYVFSLFFFFYKVIFRKASAGPDTARYKRPRDKHYGQTFFFNVYYMYISNKTSSRYARAGVRVSSNPP